MAASTEPNINLNDVLSSAVRSVQDLRMSVGNIFEMLSEGMTPSDAPEGQENKFLSNFEQRLLAVMKHFTDLEKLSNGLPPNIATPDLGNTRFLTLDSITDKTPTYQHLLQAYSWSSKTHDHATLAFATLHQNSLKRPQTSLLNTAAGKRARKLPGASLSVSFQTVENMIMKISPLVHEMNIKVTRPIGSPVVLHITLGMTLKAVVVLRGLIIEWVLVKGYNEDFVTEDGKFAAISQQQLARPDRAHPTSPGISQGPPLDLWSQSKHLVFRKVTDNTRAAMLVFYSGIHPEMAIVQFLKWLHSYVTLFSVPCIRCGKFLKDNLPPTIRSTTTLEVNHESCRP